MNRVYAEEMDGIIEKSKEFLEEKLPLVGEIVKIKGSCFKGEQVVEFRDRV